MKAKHILIASFILIVLHALTMISSCGTMKKHKVETTEEQSSELVQSDKETQTIVNTWKEIQNEWLHELELNSASITRDTVILSKLSSKKTGTQAIRSQALKENKQKEQSFQVQNNELKSAIRSDKEREPPRVLFWLGFISLIIIGLAWFMKKT